MSCTPDSTPSQMKYYLIITPATTSSIMSFITTWEDLPGTIIIIIKNTLSSLSQLLLIHPNPAHEVLGLTATVPLQQLIIRNLEGQFLLSKELSGVSESIDVSRLPAGIYFAEVKFRNTNVVMKKVVLL